MNKYSKYVTKLFAMVFALMCMSSAHAAYILDTLVGQALLGNSGDATELNAIRAATGDNSLTQDFKIEGASVVALLNPGTTDQWYVDVAPTTPGYFLLKLGIGGTNATADTFFFQNIGELTKLVWSNAQVQFLTGGNCRTGNDDACNIGRLSHYNGYGDGTTSVPEPATLGLLALGLLGLAGIRRRAS